MGTCWPFGWRGTACSVVTGSRSTRRFSGLPDFPDCRRGVSRSLGSYDLFAPDHTLIRVGFYADAGNGVTDG